MHLNYDDRRSKILRDFARWAAASAARQGSSVRGRNLYEHIDRVDINALLHGIEHYDHWHKREVTNLAAMSGLEIGWAAKIVNMLTKVRVFIATEGPRSLLDVIHPPIDNQLIDEIKRKFPLKGEEIERNGLLRSLCDKGKPINHVRNYESYLEVIKGLRMVAGRIKCSLFEVESLWTG